MTCALDSPSEVLDLLAPVSLESLDSQAALHTRVDHKYLVPDAVFQEFLGFSTNRLSVLTIAGRRSFDYRSVYFDSPDLSCFRAHLQQRRRRFKVRTRTYMNSCDCVLEVKTKGARTETIKTRLPYAPSSATTLTRPGQAFINEILPGAELGLFRPSLETIYSRTTLLDGPANSRITADSSVVFSANGRTANLRAGTVLVETKSIAGCGLADRWLWKCGVRPVSLSKYCVGVAMLHPEARTNPWHRVIKQHFE